MAQYLSLRSHVVTRLNGNRIIGYGLGIYIGIFVIIFKLLNIPILSPVTIGFIVTVPFFVLFSTVERDKQDFIRNLLFTTGFFCIAKMILPGRTTMAYLIPSMWIFIITKILISDSG